MPRIYFGEKEIECKSGDNLRKTLLNNELSPHNSSAKLLNCMGLGSCGTCAIEIVKGEPHAKTKIEEWRLNFPPHTSKTKLRLACQIKVEGDLHICKHPGFWGEKRS